MSTEYSEETIKTMVHMGILGYDVDKCLNIVEVDNEEQFKKDFENPQSVIAKSYKKGKDKADYAIDMKLFEKAKSGDLKALQKYEERKEYGK